MPRWYVKRSATPTIPRTSPQPGQGPPAGPPADHSPLTPDDWGPLTGTELLELVRHRKVIATTLIRKDDSAWFPASQVGGLFAAAVKPTLSYHCPSCGVAVPPPPCQCPGCQREIHQLRPRIVQHSIDGSETPQPDSQTNRSMTNWLDKVARRKR